jgi:hypothetical protein
MGPIRSRVFWVALLLVVPWSAASAVNSNEGEHAGLLHRIVTDEYYYVLTDSVQISYTVTNITAEPIGILLPMVNCPLWIRVYGPQGGEAIWVDPPGCLDEAGGVWLLPGESLWREAVWDMRNIYTGQLIDEPGEYAVEGELFALDPEIRFAIEVQIEIMDPATGLPAEELSLPSTWTTMKALYR